MLQEERCCYREQNSSPNYSLKLQSEVYFGSRVGTAILIQMITLRMKAHCKVSVMSLQFFWLF
jgi:hypothetical protein